MPRRRPGYGPDGTPKQPKPAQRPTHKKYGPDGTPLPQPGSSAGRHWINETSGVDRDGTHWTIPGHWSDESRPNPKPQPVFHNEHRCHMDGAFIIVGGYLRIYDNEVPKGTRGHELYLAFGGLGIGGMDGDGVLHINTDSWEDFYNRVKSFAYMAAAPSPEIPDHRLAHTVIAFYDGHSNTLGYAMPDLSVDIGVAGGTVKVKS